MTEKFENKVGGISHARKKRLSMLWEKLDTSNFCRYQQQNS